MRKNSSSVLALIAPLACFAACSSIDAPSTSSATPQPASSGASGAASSARSFSLVGDSKSLHLQGTPADPSYSATYPVTDLTAMTVTVGAFGDLSATCGGAGGAVACDCLPFFSEVSAHGVNVFDAYGKGVMYVPSPACNDAGVLLDDAGSIIPPVPPVGEDGGDDAGAPISIDAGACAPSVVETFSGCSITVGAITCDCSDPTCAGNAIEVCLASIGVPVGNGTAGGGSGLDAGGGDDSGHHHGGGGGGGPPSYDGGAFGGGSDDAGSDPFADASNDDGATGGACSGGAIASVQAQFCADVDAALTAHGISFTLDCSALGTLAFPKSHAAPPASGLSCKALTHDAFAKVRAELSTCSPYDYVEWKFSATLQLFEAGVCTIW